MAEVDLAESQMEVLVHFQVCFSDARMWNSTRNPYVY